MISMDVWESSIGMAVELVVINVSILVSTRVIQMKMITLGLLRFTKKVYKNYSSLLKVNCSQSNIVYYNTT